MPTKPKVPLTVMLKDLQDGVLTPEQFNNYLSTGSISKTANPGAKVINSDNAQHGKLQMPIVSPGGGSVSVNPATALGIAGGALTGGATGGLAAAALGGLGGGTSRTFGDAAASTALGALPLAGKLGEVLRAKGILSAAPGTGRIAGALKGAAGGATASALAQEIKSVVDNHSLAKPDLMATAAGGVIGGVAGAAGARPAGAPTTAEQKALDAAAAVKAHEEQARQFEEQIASHKALVEKVNRQVTAAGEKHADAAKELKDATNVMKTAEQTAGAGQRQDFLNGQNRFNANITRKKIDLRDALETQEDAAAAVAAHEKELAAKEADAQKALRRGRDANGQIDPTRGAGRDSQFTHDPEDLEKLARLQDAHADSYVKTKTLQEELDQLHIDKADHKAAGKGSMLTDQGLLDDHAAASTAEDAAHAKYRQLQSTLRAYQDQLSDLTKSSKIHDLNAPEGAPTAISGRDILGMGAELGGIVLPKTGKIAKSLLSRVPKSDEPPGAGLKFLIDQLLARANAAQAPVVANSSPTPIENSSPTPLAPDQPQE